MNEAVFIKPIAVALNNEERLRQMYDVSPATWLRWHESEGAPISYPHGRGQGKQGYIPTREAENWLAKKATAKG